MQIAAKRKFAITCVLAVCAVIVLGCVLPALAPSNCGGNSAAKTDCRIYGMTIRIVAPDNGGVFDLSKLSDSERKETVEIANDHWIRGATLLLKMTSFKPDDDKKHIVAVWNRAYDNIPQPNLWNGYKKTPAHAVTYSDGSAGLISPAEFERLDLSDFVSAKDLVIASVPVTPPTDTK